MGRLGFEYVDAGGRRIRDVERLARIRALAIPPAWTDVWICTDPRGHLQATGRDARGRKQYRYHPGWRQCRDETKFHRMRAFAAALPRIRARTQADLARPGLPREKVLATVVQLLERSLIRVGNDEYAKANRSFGLTTLRDSHAEVRGATVRFSFRGKSGVRHEVAVDDRRLARVVARCRDLPGQELFQYLDRDAAGAERVQDVTSADVNAYLKEATGDVFTAKDFRTWAGSVLALTALRTVDPAPTKAGRRRQLLQAIDAVAGLLGNTRSVCRASYIHPAVLDAFEAGDLEGRAPTPAPSPLRRREVPRGGLSPDERAFLRVLERRAREDARAARGRRSAA